MTRFPASAVCLTALALFFNQSFASEEAADEPDLAWQGDGTYVLEDMVVVGRTNIKGVEYEPDGTMSIVSTSLFTIFEALDSSSGAAVNFHVSFAKNSTVMNADGQHQLDQMAKALKYMSDDTQFELLVYKGSSQSPESRRRDLEENRVKEIMSKLRLRYQLKNEISVNFQPSNKRLTAKQAKNQNYQTLAMTIINLGEKG